MSTHKTVLTAIAGATASLLAISAFAAQSSYPSHYGFGTTPTPQELKSFFAVPPSGKGLPPGMGTFAEGQQVYMQHCAVCHGDLLQGIPTKGIGGDKLIGGRGSLTTDAPVKTVESYWPYATTLFDYIKRAMPFNAPGSLDDKQVYGVVAYILGEAKIVPEDAVIDAKTLPKVRMPNRNGFVGDPRPEIELYR